MFSPEKRCKYRKNQLAKVICQIRFPEIAQIQKRVPVEFHEAVRKMFPLYEVHQDRSMPHVTGVGEDLKIEKIPPMMNYAFSAEDGQWQINLTSRFISLSSQKYTCWEEFGGMLDFPLTEFLKLYTPMWFDCIGLRYLNFISRKNLEMEEQPFRELLKSQYIGILADQQVCEEARIHVGLDAGIPLPDGCRAKIHSGTGLVRNGKTLDSEVKLIFDQDLYIPGKIPVCRSVSSLETLHSHAWSIFRGAITNRLHEAMGPEEI